MWLPAIGGDPAVYTSRNDRHKAAIQSHRDLQKDILHMYMYALLLLHSCLPLYLRSVIPTSVGIPSQCGTGEVEDLDPVRRTDPGD